MLSFVVVYPHPLRVQSWSPRSTSTGLSNTFVVFMLTLLAVYLAHPCCRTPLYLVSNMKFTTWSYGELAGKAAAFASSLRRAGLSRGSTILILSPPTTRGDSIALALALQAVGATVIYGDP